MRSQRQIILICLQIYSAVQIDVNKVLEELRLPWSPKPSYPGETMTASNDYLAWFEDLLAQHPWDANSILRQLGIIRAPNLYHQDHHRILRMLDSAFDHDLGISSELFAHMSLIGTLYETALLRIWSNFNKSSFRTISRIGSSAETEDLIKTIKAVLHRHSGDTEATGTRPYKRLQLLVVDHETLRYVKRSIQTLRLVLGLHHDPRMLFWYIYTPTNAIFNWRCG